MGKYNIEEMPKIVGRNIRKLRKAHNLTCCKMNEIVGYKSPQGGNMSNVELGKTNVGIMSFDKLLKICNYFGVTLDQLCNPDLKVTTNIVVDVKVEG